jgi:hypothetical protein
VRRERCPAASTDQGRRLVRRPRDRDGPDSRLLFRAELAGQLDSGGRRLGQRGAKQRASFFRSCRRPAPVLFRRWDSGTALSRRGPGRLISIFIRRIEVQIESSRLSVGRTLSSRNFGLAAQAASCISRGHRAPRLTRDGGQGAPPRVQMGPAERCQLAFGYQLLSVCELAPAAGARHFRPSSERPQSGRPRRPPVDVDRRREQPPADRIRVVCGRSIIARPAARPLTR